MKVLIYEPGRDGHRSVYLRYINEAFMQAGCGTFVITESYAGRPLALAQLAVEIEAKTIFICTLDGLYSWLTVLCAGCRIQGIRVVGIYYLFNNLYEGWKGCLWRLLIKSRFLFHVFVPDLALKRRSLGGLAGRISFIPDPWDAKYLRSILRESAMRDCGVKELNACVFLLFGEISERKGVHHILSVLEKWNYELRPYIKVLIVGRILDRIDAEIESVAARNPNIKSALLFESRWITEAEHSRYFSAATYLCALYPKSFRVSISTVIRAFAIARPVIVGDHGMIGEIVAQTKAGYVCDVASPYSILRTFEEAYDTYTCDKNLYDTLSFAGGEIALSCELTHFNFIITTWVARFCRKHFNKNAL